MYVKVVDTVKVIAGDDKGKIGEITKIFRHNSKVVVKDINLQIKHVKSQEEVEPGKIIKVNTCLELLKWSNGSAAGGEIESFRIEAPMHSSIVMLYSKEKNVTSRAGRAGHKLLEDGTRVRYVIKTSEIIDSAKNWKKLEAKTKAEVAAAS